MPAIPDDTLGILAPNIIVRVGTPPPYTSEGVSESNIIPRLDLITIDIASKKTMDIDQDYTKALIKEARKKHLLTFLIKDYGSSGKIVLPPGVPPPPPSPEPPESPPSLPPSPFLESPPSTSKKRQEILDISEADPFPEIGYYSRDLVGVVPTPLVDPPPGTPEPTPDNWTPLEISSLPYFASFPSAIYVPAINSCISTPYYAPEAKRHLNGVLGSTFNVIPGKTVYLWDSSNKTSGPSIEPPISTREDGSIRLIPTI